MGNANLSLRLQVPRLAIKTKQKALGKFMESRFQYNLVILCTPLLNELATKKAKLGKWFGRMSAH